MVWCDRKTGDTERQLSGVLDCLFYFRDEALNEIAPWFYY